MATALPGTGVPVSTDILTTLNGGAATTGEAIQRIKLSTGVPGTATDVSAANPVPTTVVDVTANGTLAGVGQTVQISMSGGLFNRF